MIKKFSTLLLIAGIGFLTSCNPDTESAATNKTDTVLIDQMKFVPQDLTVNKGDTVVFINKDIVAHNATEVDSAWRSPDLNMGESWSFVPEKSADYFCSIHIVMKGHIEVK